MSEHLVGREAGPSLGRVTDTVELGEWRMHQDAMATRLEQIADIERRIAALQAEQVALTASFIDERLRFDEMHGFVSDAAQYRGMVAEVAIAKQVSASTAAGFMDDAWTLARHNPATLAALRTGRIALSAARAIARETAVLDDAGRRALADRVIAEEAPDLLPGKVRAMAEQRVTEIDPDAAGRRSLRERADKHLELQPAGSGMAWLSAYLPAEQAGSAFASVRDHARRLRAGGDPRSTSHLMCDTLVERLTGTTTDALPAQVNVVMTDATLLGLSDEPAQLVGVGSVPGAAARELATNGKAWLRRFLTDPVDGSLTHGDTRRRRIDGSLRALVTARDQHCRGIQCAAPITDLDHLREYAKGGPTTLDNAQGLSKGCHTAREDPRMRVDRNRHTGVVTWTTPSGLVYHSLPPPPHASGLTRTQRNLRKLLLHPPPSRLEQHLTRQLVSHLRTQRCRR